MKALIDRLLKALAGIFGRRKNGMSLNDLLVSIAEKNVFVLKGDIKIKLVNGGVEFESKLNSEVREKKNNKTVAKMLLPLKAKLGLDELVIPLRPPK